MMEGLRFMPYEAYKDSYVDWIGSIPSTWDVQRAKWLFKRMDRAVRPEDNIVTCFRDGEVTLRNNRRTEGFTTALKEIGYQGIRKGDLVIHAMDAFAGAIGVSDSDGKATPVYSACVPRQPNTVDPTFYAYYMRHLALSGFLVSLAKGIRERSTDFRFNDFAELEVPLPSLPEQHAIVSFLDEKCAKVDRAVGIKEDQIALLRERRQIIIQDAVTCGLNPAAPMKESGIDWIGQIPAHWEIARLGTCLTSVTVKNNPDLPLLSITREKGVIERDIDDQESNHNFIPDDLSNYKVIRDGQFGMNKMKAWQGSYGISPYTGIVSPAYFIFDLIADFDPRFFNLAIRTKLYVSYFYQASDGVRIGQWDLSKDRMKQIPFIIPSKSEQAQIVVFAERISAKIDSGIAIKEQQIAVLKEYKTSLINAAVTGKIKVI